MTDILKHVCKQYDVRKIWFRRENNYEENELVFRLCPFSGELM